jgi:dedicator of cytokinesis protein 3
LRSIADSQFSNRSATASEPAARAWFVTELRQVFETGPAIDDRFHSKVAIFLDEIELFIALLENVRELPETPEWADERAAATFQMLDFIRRIGRDGLYVRFVHQLKDIFVREKNWLAAGLTLKLHSDLYDWRAEGDLVDRCTEGDLNLPAQTPFARKEAIYRHCLEYFGEYIPLLSPIQ